MPRPKKKAKPSAAKPSVEGPAGGESPESGMSATAVAEAPVAELQPPTAPVETTEAENAQSEDVAQKDKDKDRVAAGSINIAKLQAMSMPELNQMARDLAVENFGTMRKHEVIFHILQKNAERAGVLFSEGVLDRK